MGFQLLMPSVGPRGPELSICPVEIKVVSAQLSFLLTKIKVARSADFILVGQNESCAEATFILTGQIESSGPRWPTEGIKS